ncbi:unnamed protein product [Symbiodinium necroappetens]|uniref:Uncharacterized protein n=1 Tax=Symbiodinium necroappetens TaxID=1628268 RepID=A0A812M8D9_9DINO|nr:unnamed protein product [Symbiodinium necroappetens]
MLLLLPLPLLLLLLLLWFLLATAVAVAGMYIALAAARLALMTTWIISTMRGDEMAKAGHDDYADADMVVMIELEKKHDLVYETANG